MNLLSIIQAIQTGWVVARVNIEETGLAEVKDSRRATENFSETGEFRQKV